jgi:hypothetical protein
MFTNDYEVTLANVGNGAAEEVFREEWQKVMDNIADPNTKADAVREISIHLSIKPDTDRGFSKIEIFGNSKLQKMVPFTTTFVHGKHNGKNDAREILQENWIKNKEKSDKVSEITGRKEGLSNE